MRWLLLLLGLLGIGSAGAAPLLQAPAPAPLDPGASVVIPLTTASTAPTVAGLDLTLVLTAEPAEALAHATLALEKGAQTGDWQFLALDTPTHRALLVGLPGLAPGSEVLRVRVTFDASTPRTARFTLTAAPGVWADATGKETNVAEVLAPVSVTFLTCLPGDLNRDGRVTLGDAVRCLTLVLTPTMPLPNPCFRDAADANGDGTVNLADVLQILRLVVGI